MPIDDVRRAMCVMAAVAPWTRALAANTFDPLRTAALDRAVEAAVHDGRIPGAAVWVERDGVAHHRAHGRRSVEPKPEPLDESAVYDVASLTKVVSTAPVMARLLEDGALSLDDPVRRTLAEFASGEAITLRHLLTHTSGLPAGVPAAPDWRGYEAGVALACSQAATHAPGTFFRYSDVNFILLGEIAQRATGRALNVLAQDWVFGPLRMVDTGYLPKAAPQRLVPTQWDGDNMLRGEVHDPTCRWMGGVAGHAGVFSTTADLARYARMLIGGGSLDGVRVLQPQTVALMTQTASPAAVPERRGLGWDIDSPYSKPRGSVYPVGSFGHTGFTGCVLWVDPASRAFHVFLSNRVHPRGGQSIVPLYAEVGTLAARAALESTR